MAGSVNKVILVGNLGKDPEIRRTQDGRPIANLSVATSETWRDKNTGERKEKTEWHRVVVFNEGLCKVIEQYLKKGAKVYIEMPRGLAQGEAPPLFVIGAEGEGQLVNYRVNKNYYIVDRLFSAAELRLGGRTQQIVRITRNEGGWFW